jgi:cytochrome P450
MTDQIGLDALDFDPYSKTFFDDPYDVYRRLRDEQPVYFNERYNFFALSRWDDVVEAHRDWRDYSSAHGVTLDVLNAEKVPDQSMLIMIDPPRHDRLRALVSRSFTPRAIRDLEPMITEVIVRHLDALEPTGEMDLLGDFAALFPVEIVCRMLGVPSEQVEPIRHLVDVFLTRRVGEVAPSKESRSAIVEIGMRFFELAGEKRAHPADDMLTRLTQAEVESEDGGTTRLDDVEIAGFGTLICAAGAETVTKLVGNAIVLFEQNPDQWRLVLDDPGLIPAAVEETLRYHPPSQYQGRFCRHDVELHGTTIPARSPVLLLTGAATRDPRAFDDPDRFDITRRPSLSLGFGHGIHSCLGAALARLESRIAITEVARRFPRYEVDAAGLERVQMANVAGYSRVPVRVRP